MLLIAVPVILKHHNQASLFKSKAWNFNFEATLQHIAHSSVLLCRSEKSNIKFERLSLIDSISQIFIVGIMYQVNTQT